MEIAAAKMIGAGLAMTAGLGAGIGLGNIFNGIFYLMCGSNILFQFIEMGRSLYKKYRAYKIKKRNENIIKQRLLAKQKLKDE